MRKLTVGIALSGTVHAAAVAWVIAYKPAPGPTVTGHATVIELIDVMRAEAPAVEVTFLDEATTAAIPEAPAIPSPERGVVVPHDQRTPQREHGSAAIATRTGGRDLGPGPGTGPGAEAPVTGSKNPLLDMRKGAPVRLTVGVPTGRWDGREHAPETYGPDIESGQLDHDGGGTYRSDQGPFTAKVDRDGSVNLKDKRNFHIHFGVPSPRSAGRSIAKWYTQKDKPTGTIGPVDTRPRTNLDESSSADDKADDGDTIEILSGGFDITDALMRRHGQDPYASKKLAFLDSTRDQRVQIGQRYRQQQLAQATQIMQKNLDRMWTTLNDPAARRQALFELWDECAETGSEDLVIAGRAARKLVVGFIRARLPAGSELAYLADELRSLNHKKQSSATFAPYD